VAIPTVMISKKAGDLIKNFMLTNPETPVEISALFPLRKNNTQVNLDFWYSSGDVNSYHFVKRFSPYIMEFGKNIDFIPHIVTWYSGNAEMKNFTELEANCVSGGRYCAPDPDGIGPANGSLVVIQDLRQLCLVRTVGLWSWISFMMQYPQFCTDKYDDDCYHRMIPMFVEELDILKLNKCFDDSFAGKDIMIEENTILKAERESFQHADVQYWPALLVDHKQYTGPLAPVDAIVSLICEALDADHERCVDLDEEDAPVVVEGDEQWIEVVVICSAILLFIVVAFVFYRNVVKKELKQEMTVQLQQMIGDYAAFVDKRKYKFDNL